MSIEYPWYESVSDGTLRQGDIFFDFPVFVAKADATVMRRYLSGDSKVNFGGTVLKMNVIVASQSCDLEHDKVKSVILCPIWALNHVSCRILDHNPAGSDLDNTVVIAGGDRSLG